VPMDYISVLRFCFTLLLIVKVATPTDTMHSTQPVRDGDSMVSAGGSGGAT